MTTKSEVEVLAALTVAEAIELVCDRAEDTTWALDDVENAMLAEAIKIAREVRCPF